MERQGFGIRLGALLIDIIALILISFIVGLIFGHGLSFSYRYGAPQGGIGYSLVMSLLTLGYWSTEIFNAASPGKKLLGLSIASETGSAATQNQLVMRWAFKNAGSLIGLVATLVGAVIPIFGFVLPIIAGLAGLAGLLGCVLSPWPA